MNIEAQELQQVAAAQAPRLDLYAGIHKALRALMADTLLAVGRMDFDDELERTQVSQRVLEMLEFCSSHLKHENEFVHHAIEVRAPGASDVAAHQHDEHGKAIEHLAEAVAHLRACAAAQRPLATERLYRDLALFVAENLQHMHVEETAHNAVLWARYTDGELMAVHDALVASIPPHEAIYTWRWMGPFMSPAERLRMLSGMREKAPAAVFEAVLQTVRPHLTQVEWDKLARGLGFSFSPEPFRS